MIMQRMRTRGFFANVTYAQGDRRAQLRQIHIEPSRSRMEQARNSRGQPTVILLQCGFRR